MGDLCKGKKRRKKSKKGVDKWDMLWYSNKAVAEVNTSRERKTHTKRTERQKLLEKNSKKVLDKRNEVWYDKKCSAERRVPCKLNNVTNEKHQTETALRS